MFGIFRYNNVLWNLTAENRQSLTFSHDERLCTLDLLSLIWGLQRQIEPKGRMWGNHWQFRHLSLTETQVSRSPVESTHIGLVMKSFNYFDVGIYKFMALMCRHCNAPNFCHVQISMPCLARTGVTKAPFVNFSVRKIFDLAKETFTLFESHSYLTGVTAAELRLYLTNMNVIFNS